MKTYNRQSGNALWFILLAVALLAALTATISRSSDTAEQSGNVERFRIDASDMMRHTASIKEAMGKMRLSGMGENQFSFENSFTATDYSNGTCRDCLVYGSAGAGIAYRTPNTNWLDSGHSGDPRYGEWEFAATNAVTGVSSARPDLIMYIGYLKQGMCTQINNMLGISGIPATNGFDTTAFQGSIPSAAADTIDNMNGAEVGCFQDTSGTRDYTYYQVLIKR